MVEKIESALQQGQPIPMPPIERAARDQSLPLSFAQERIWFMHQLDLQRAAYNIGGTLRLRHAFDLDGLRWTMEQVVLRHEILRTAFPTVNGLPVQVILPPTDFQVTVIDLRELPEPERIARVTELVKADLRAPFDLSQAPLFRTYVYRLGEDDQVVVLIMHPIISDAWSMGVVKRELFLLLQAYASGKQNNLPPLPIQYADFALTERQWLQGEVLESQLAYWREKLRGATMLELPTDHPRPLTQTYNRATQQFELANVLIETLSELCQSEGVTLFMALFAAFNILLYRYTSQQDILVGAPVANRNAQATENLIGAFENTLVLRTDLSGNPTFRALLQRVRSIMVEAFAHQDIPFAKLAAEFNPQRDTRYTSFIQTMFNVTNAPMDDFSDSLPGEYAINQGAAQFDLACTVIDTRNNHHVIFEYNTDLFDAATIVRMGNHFRTLLHSIVVQPDTEISTLPLLIDSEREQILVEWNNTRADYPQQCLHQLFEAQVARTPDAVAVRWNDQTLSFRELNAYANQMAHYLRKLGVAAETLVGLCTERSPEMIVGLLGILKAGGAYVPLDPTYPRERFAFMLEDTRLQVIVTQQAYQESFAESGSRRVVLDRDKSELARESAENLSAPANPEQLAYVLYTSGSTGQPKGVLFEHCNTVAFLSAVATIFDADARAGMLAANSINWDFSVLEIFLPLCWGGTVLLAENMLQLGSLATSNLIHSMYAAPSIMARILQVGGLPASVHTIVVGGELLTESLARALLGLGKQLWNIWGPTETTTFSTYSLIVPDAVMPPSIGRPISNTQIYILDEHLQPVPVGVVGELFVGGAGVTRGYLKRAELTAGKFIPDPFAREPNARLYKTGDLARYRPDGAMEFAGRRDHQIKLHGHRIEPEEIAETLKRHPNIRNAVVLARENGASEKQLVAYIVRDSAMSLSNRDLHEFLKQKLPAYMIPSNFVLMDALPMMPNGKLDRKALPQPPPPEMAHPDSLTLPRDRTELELCQFWEELLKVSRVGPGDNFFELGGDSVLAAQLCTAISKRYGHYLPLRVLFDAPTVESLAEIIRAQEWQPEWTAVVPIQPQGALPSLFYFPPRNAVLGIYPFIETLGKDQPVYGLLATPHGDHNPFSRIEDEASYYAAQICALQPEGPYYLAGWSYGGITAFETARQLRMRGAAIPFLGILDSGYYLTDWRGRLGYYRRRLHYLAGLSRHEQLSRLRNHARLSAPGVQVQAHRRRSLEENDLTKLTGNDTRADQIRMARYTPRSYSGRIRLFRTRDHAPHQARDPLMGWGRVARAGVEVYYIEGDHLTMMKEPYVRDLAGKFRTILTKAQSEMGTKSQGRGDVS